jgi:mannose-6-phosphate isomerase
MTGETYPLLMTPAIHAMPWGGTRLRDVLGKTIPEELSNAPIGEAWEISANPRGTSRVANGPLSGMPLGEVVRGWGPRLLGSAIHARYRGAFPLLSKLVDASALSSVQVHPDDVHASREGGLPMGKCEAWYVLDALPNASAWIGFRVGTTREEFEESIACCSPRSLLAPVGLAAGDCVAVDAGTVHAAGNGLLILEFQQASDLAYRIYDWDRTDEDGFRRPLDITGALTVIDFAARARKARSNGPPDTVVELVRNPHFRVFELDLRTSCEWPPEEVFRMFTVARGTCSIARRGFRLSLRTGDSVLLPAGLDCGFELGKALIVGAAPLPDGNAPRSA